MVTPDTKSSSTTPVILGMNVLQVLLSECKSNFEHKFLQKANLHTARFLSFRTIIVRERELKKQKNRLAVVKNASSDKVNLGPNESIRLSCYTDKELNLPPTATIIQGTEDSNIPSFIDITPGVIHYQHGKNSEITVQLSNLSTNTISIPPKAIVCELQPVNIAEDVFD